MQKFKLATLNVLLYTRSGAKCTYDTLAFSWRFILSLILSNVAHKSLNLFCIFFTGLTWTHCESESTWVESESESESIRPESESTALESESTEVESESESESTGVESESGLESGLGLGLTQVHESGLAPNWKKPLEMCSYLRKFQKNSQISRFLREKNL